jgi:sugar lactone lactonase YvrE
MFRPRIVTSLFALIALAGAGACENKNEKPTTTTSATQPTAPTAVVTATPSNEMAMRPGAAIPTATKKGEPIVTYKGLGLATPESVIHDDALDAYLVSSINGKPTDVDNNGFITRLSPDGKVETLRWIEGGKNKVTLNAPKGLGLMGDNLYVADLDTVRIFDRKTGAPNGEVKIPGATFLNDLAITTDGHVLVSDSGLKAGAKGFDPTGTDAVWSIDKAKKVSPLMKSKELGSPNGLLSGTDKTWVSSFGTGELYALDSKGKKTDVKKLPKGALDGIVILPGGDLLVASWEANAIYRGKPGGDFTAVIEDVKSPADIGYDVKRGRVLVPLFESDEVRVYDIK